MLTGVTPARLPPCVFLAPSSGPPAFLLTGLNIAHLYVFSSARCTAFPGHSERRSKLTARPLLRQCPFCQQGSFAIKYTGTLSQEEWMEREAEEQRVIKLQITMREDEIKRDLERTEERERRRAEGLPVIYLGPVFLLSALALSLWF